MNLEFRPFRAEVDLPQQRDLFRDCFPEAEGTPQIEERHYRWKFHSFPAERPSYEYAAYADGKLVGYYAALPFPYVFNGVEYRGAMVCDVMTHSSMRGKGIFTKLGAYALGEMSKEGLDLTFGYPIRPEVIPGHLKVGWKLAGKLPLYMRVLRTNTALKNHRLRVAAPLLNLGTQLYSAVLASKRVPEGYEVRRLSLNEFCALSGAESILERAARSAGVGLLKTSQFLQWRYGAPETSYTVVAAFRGGSLEAVAFTRATDLKGISSLALLDVVSVSRAQGGLNPLFAEIENLAVANDVDTITTMITPTRAAELKLIRRGFLRTPFVFDLIVRPLTKKGEALASLTANDFHPMWVDSDDL